jgi:GDPmannose 4,6-dehydratase
MGNIDAMRDWGYSPDYVVAMHAMLQQNRPGDFVIATGQLHSVRDFLDKAFSVVGLDYEAYTHINPSYFRPGEVVPLCGDASKASRELGWKPALGFEDIVKEMVSADIAHFERAQ